MAKIKVRKDVAEEVTSKLQGNKNIFSLDKEDELEKSHLYSDKYWVAGKGKKGGYWEYIYNKNNRIDKTLKTTNEKPLTIVYDKTQDNFTQSLQILSQAFDYVDTWLDDWADPKNASKSICKELRGKKICFNDISYEHIAVSGSHSKASKKNGKNLREPKNLLNHVPYLPIAKKSLEDEGLWTQARYEPLKKRKLDKTNGKVIKGYVYQTLSVELPKGSVHKYAQTTVSKIKYVDDSYSDTVYISVVGKDSIKTGEKTVKKSLANELDFVTKGKTTSIRASSYDPGSTRQAFTTLIIPQQNNLSSKKVIKSIVPDYAGENRKGKTFDIQITDITENNKQQKFEQFTKALNAIADKKPFMIKHIPADNSEHYENLTVRLMDFDRSKIEKAVHKVALSLDADVLASSKGESFVYESQKEITEKFYKRVTDSAKAVYNFVISYFDLPDIRIISKAGELKHKGKILYNPETGKPIKESEWKKFIVELEKFLNRNYSGVGEKIVLSAESLGIILDRLSKTNSLEAIRKMSLSTLKTKRYDVDWVSESIKNMKDKFGDVISRERQARIQIAMDSAAQRVTRVKDDMRNNIQQIIIDGIRDKQSKSVVAQNLFDKCASLNRDMQRIADSEVQMAANSSYCKEEVYNSKPGEKVYFKRFEMMDDNTCKACKKLNGTIALWSDVPLPDEHIKDTYAKYAIWEGKNEGSCPIGIVHPYCYSDDTEVMTNNGWKLFKDVEKNDKIMSINPETREIDFVSYVQKIQYEYNGDMIHFPGRNFDMLVTPNHNMLYIRQCGVYASMAAEDLIKKDFFNLPRAVGEWKHTDTKTVKFGDLTISKAQYFRLWAWYLAEGSGRLRDGHYEVKLAQKEPIKIYNDLPELQPILHINSDCVCLHGDYARYFECMFGIYADKKFIPPFIKNSSVENIREFLDAFIIADGTRFINKKCSSDKAYSEFRNEQVLRTSSKKMADDLCELIVKAGWMPSEFVVHEKGRKVQFRNGEYELNTDCHNVSICKSKTRTYAPDIEGHKPRHKPAYEKYNGMVYDVELEKWHFLLVRRNGKCGWSGNCRGTWTRYYPDLD